MWHDYFVFQKYIHFPDFSGSLSNFTNLDYLFEWITKMADKCSVWLSTERRNCHFNCATLHLPWVCSLHCPSKNFFLFFNANSLERQHNERVHGKRKVAQLKRQQFLSLDSQSKSCSYFSKILQSILSIFFVWKCT